MNDETRQPTIEELRARAGALHGRAKPGWWKRYAGEPGTGPVGKTCKTCAFKRYAGHATQHPKCGLIPYTHGDATTIKTSSPACSLYQPKGAP